MAQCIAKSKRSGERCRKHAIKTSRVCAIHGGKSLKGTDAPSFVTGRYSKYLPDQLQERYQEALQDEELIRLDDEIALIDARLREQLDRLTVVGMNAGGWDAARAHFRAFRLATNRGRRVAALEALNALEAVLDANTSDSVAWSTIRELIDDRRKLVETERRRLLDEDQVITVERLMLFVAAISDIIRRNVASREERASVADEVRLLVSGSPGSG